MSRQIDTTQWPLSKEDREYMLSRGREAELQRLEDQYNADQAAADTVVEEVAEPYEKWTVAELKDEAELRQLKVEGTAKKDYVAALEADDANTPG